MRNFDFSPLFRSTIGFDDLPRRLDSAMRFAANGDGYPPYNIENVSEDAYAITFAVAGFAEDDLEIVVQDGSLVVKGKVNDDGKERHYLHRGIAGRAFERRFQLAEDIKVEDASLANGLLTVHLVREVPEAKKPRTIAIESKSKAPQAVAA